MSNEIKRIVIVGGGSAGWLTAGLIAAEHRPNIAKNLSITLIESPDIKPIGVGEGTWPSMRATLGKIGISENEFIRECDASFKQGSMFKGWVDGSDQDVYYHPFTLPEGYKEVNLAPQWQAFKDNVSFSDAVCSQGELSRQGRAPKQIATPEFAGVVNYGYHLDAAKFSKLLETHCVNTLGVEHVRDNVTAVNGQENGDIASVSTQNTGAIEGDLFIDCTGSRALLVGEHFKIPFMCKKHILFNDSALAAQVPYSGNDDPIASMTISTAQKAGWIWDIGLPSRRGVGYTFSSAHTSDDQAADTLRHYIESSVGEVAARALTLRKLDIKPGHREKFWHKNCVAVGMAAGFIEPLEASALVLVELSAAMIAEQLPANRDVMDIVAKRFNQRFLHRWENIIDFLKLHYLMSQRKDSDYWRDIVRPESVPATLAEKLELWQHQSPWHYDETHVAEMFPSASYQYVLYGMGFPLPQPSTQRHSFQKAKARAEKYFSDNSRKISHLSKALPSNRELINKVKEFGFQKI